MDTGNITIGRYIPGETVFHHADPRAKLLILFMFIAAVFLSKGFVLFGIMFTAVIVMYVLARIPVSWLYRGIRPVFYISAITFFIHLFFTPGGAVLYRYSIITIEYEGLMTGLFTVCRLLLVVYGAMLVTLTTTPLTLTAGLEFFLRPFRLVGLPVTDMAMVLTIALRFIPVLLEESQRIARAQLARGADMGTGSIVQRIRFLIPVMVPLFISAFRRADELAIAMEARCFRAGEHRTRMYELKFRPADYTAVITALLLLILILWLYM